MSSSAPTDFPAVPEFKGVKGWEFTDISRLDVDSYAVATTAGSGAPDPLWAEVEPVARMLQVDSAAAVLEGELPAGVVVGALETAEHTAIGAHLGRVVTREDAFTARNRALYRGGAFVYVPKDVKVDGPILLSAVQSVAGSAMHWRVLVVLEEGAEAEIWEEYLSDDEGLFTTVVELVVSANAKLRFVSGQALSEKGWLFGSQRAVVERDGSLDWVALGFGGARGKVFMETKLAGAGAHAKVTGAYASHGRQHLDFDTLQEHAAPDTTSDLAFRGVLQGRASSVWRGMIKVDPGAQKTDAFQESRNLLLSDKAHADAIPGLEILANDVRCTHAAAIAQVDPEQIFYLRSRGLPTPTAQRLVIEGFLEALVERFEEGPVRQVLADALERRLQIVLG